MTTHTIYLMPGKKVGCTQNLKRRRQDYKSLWGFDPIIRILEELHDATNQQAGDREWEWADKLGYRRGSHYTVMSPEDNRRGGRKGGLLGGRKTASLGLTGSQIKTTCPHCGLQSSTATLHRWHFDNCPKVRVNPAPPPAVQTLVLDNVK